MKTNRLLPIIRSSYQAYVVHCIVELIQHTGHFRWPHFDNLSNLSNILNFGTQFLLLIPSFLFLPSSLHLLSIIMYLKGQTHKFEGEDQDDGVCVGRRFW